MPQKEEDCTYFDGSVYLLERRVPPQYAVIETNKRLVDKVEYILSGVMHTWGGAWTVEQRAMGKGKTVIRIVKKKIHRKNSKVSSFTPLEMKKVYKKRKNFSKRS